MIKKTIIGLVVLIAAVGLVFAAYGDGNNDDSTQKSISSQKQNKSVESSKTTTTKTTNTKSSNQISAEQAQKIAQKYIEEPEAKAGKPKLGKIDGKKVYTVPVMLKGDTVGEIHISAVTGKNLGGAGGVS